MDKINVQCVHIYSIFTNFYFTTDEGSNGKCYEVKAEINWQTRTKFQIIIYT